MVVMGKRGVCSEHRGKYCDSYRDCINPSCLNENGELKTKLSSLGISPKN